MIYGVVGLVICGPAGGAAIIKGNRAMKEIEASRGAISGDGWAKAAIIIGWIGLAVWAIGALILIMDRG
jgi:hypothetical protein